MASSRKLCAAGLAGLLLTPLLFAQDPAPPAAFAFGVVADVQYADQPTAGRRHYRASLANLRQCVERLNRHELACVVQLGDLIDTGKDSFDAVLPIWDRLRAPRYHVIGNHDLPMPRQRVLARLGLHQGYRAFAAGPGWRFVILDGMDVSLYGYPKDHPKRQQAARMLAALKAQKAKNAQPWNGGIGTEQLAWLDRTLRTASEQGERVALFCHFPILAKASSPHHLLWNHDQVLARIEQHPCVAAWFNGHDHAGGHAERHGIHHLTLSGMVEAPKHNAYAVVEVFADRLEVRGVGRQPSRSLTLRPPPRPATGQPTKGRQESSRRVPVGR